MIMLEAIGVEGDAPVVCSKCEGSVEIHETSVYRCADCFGFPILCRQCVLDEHSRSPFHRIQVSKLIVFLILFSDCVDV
jgi:hypothetical protein